MLRANLLSTFNKNITKPGEIDLLFRKIGGTAFVNCYTPAPDSPRSIAALQTGLYPKNNGCNSRIKWPYYYLNEEISNFYELLGANNYKINLYLTDVNQQVGILPKKLHPNVNIYNSINDIIHEINTDCHTKDNSFHSLVLDDYHWSISDNGANSLGDYYGQKHLANTINNLFEGVNIDNFDYIFIYSDHGFQLTSEQNISKLFLTNDNRSKITMFMRKKGDNKIILNQKLSSNLDIYSTLEDILESKKKVKTDGISLLKNRDHDNIVIEDHNKFNVNLNQVVENWAVRTKDYFYFKNLYKDALFKVNSPNDYQLVVSPNIQLIQNFQDAIANKSSSYKEINKQHKILESYKDMCDSRALYSDGQPRVKDINSMYLKIYRKLYRNKYKRW